MLVFFAVIVVQVYAGDAVVHGLKTFFDALFRRSIAKMRVADVKIKAQAGQSRLVHKGAQVRWIAHFAGGIFDAQSDAAMVSVKTPMFKRAERGVAFTRVRGFP